VTNIPNQAGDFYSHSLSARAAGCVVPPADETPIAAPQVALRLALVQAMQGKLIGQQEALRAIAAIEQLDPPSE